MGDQAGHAAEEGFADVVASLPADPLAAGAVQPGNTLCAARTSSRTRLTLPRLEERVGAMGVWVVGVVADDAVTRIRREFPKLPSAGGLSPRFPEDLTWWCEKSQSEAFFDSSGSRGPVPTAAAFRFSAFVENSRISFDAVERMKDAVMDVFPQEIGEDLFCATARKADPSAALAYGLGPAATLQLPGWFGDFLLSSEEAAAALPKAEKVLDLTGERRAAAVSRMREWMTVMVDDPGHDVEELLEGPLRVLRSAARTGNGVAGQTRWY